MGEQKNMTKQEFQCLREMRMNKLCSEHRELISCLQELVDIVEGFLNHGYEMDSFTTQPAIVLLKKINKGR